MTVQPSGANAAAAPQHPTFKEALRFWIKLGFISFGGPTGQIAIMHSELVERRRWISEARFLHALNYCMLLPGPEAQQLATYIGWLLHRTWGGIVAGGFFVLPSVVILWILSFVYVKFGNQPWIAAAFEGLKPAVLAIVAFAVLRIGRKALKNSTLWVIASAAFVAIFFFEVPFPAIVFSAGLIGFIGYGIHPERFCVLKPHGADVGGQAVLSDEVHAALKDSKPSTIRAIKVIVVCGILWWAPPLIIMAWLGKEHAISQQGIFFSKAALVTFGGAYAVLPYIAQQAVERFTWLEAGQMLDGLGLAESTPGPLIMVVQFVGFIGAWNHPGILSPIVAGTLGALLTTWVTFLPCFLWIFLGAPYVEHLRSNARINASLSAVTAAVVGVVLNLAVWFGLHVLVPNPGRPDFFAVAVATVAFIALERLKADVMVIVGLGALSGILKLAFSGGS